MDIIQLLKENKYFEKEVFKNSRFGKYIEAYTNFLPDNFDIYAKINERVLDYCDAETNEPILSVTISAIYIFILNEQKNKVVDSFCLFLPFTARTENDFSAVDGLMNEFKQDQENFNYKIHTLEVGRTTEKVKIDA